MESDNLDKNIKKLIEGSEMYYAREAEQAYNRIRKAVENKEVPVAPWTYWLSTAAAVALLFLVSSMFIVINNKKEAEINTLRQEIHQLYFLAAQKDQDLQNSHVQIKEIMSQKLDYESKINLLSYANLDKKSAQRDTVYVVRTKEVVKVIEKSNATDQPEIVSLPDKLEAPAETLENQEMATGQFLFAEMDQEKPKKDKKPLIRFRLGNGGGSTEAFSQSRPLAITKSIY